MTTDLVRSTSGARLTLDTSEQSVIKNDGLAILLCERNSTTQVSPGVHTVWCSIFGEANIIAIGSSIQLQKGDIVVTDSQVRHDVLVEGKGVCLAVAGTSQAWSAIGDAADVGSRPAPLLFPAIYRNQRELCRRLLRLAQHRRAADAQTSYKNFAYVLARILEDMQSGFAGPISRCPGSTLARKRAVFMRLQRIRNHIATCAHEDIDIGKLALAANYSVSHFITIFRSVFGETPYSSISRLRLKKASALLSCSNLGVGEIAHSIGFSSQSSFSRAMRVHLGKSATEFRASVTRPGTSWLENQKTHTLP